MSLLCFASLKEAKNAGLKSLYLSPDQVELRGCDSYTASMLNSYNTQHRDDLMMVQRMVEEGKAQFECFSIHDKDSGKQAVVMGFVMMLGIFTTKDGCLCWQFNEDGCGAYVRPEPVSKSP